MGLEQLVEETKAVLPSYSTFVAATTADHITTYLAVQRMGADAESNPIFRQTMQDLGTGAGVGAHYTFCLVGAMSLSLIYQRISGSGARMNYIFAGICGAVAINNAYELLK